MYRILLIVIMCTGFTACGGESDSATPPEMQALIAPENIALKLQTPLREHGYSNLSAAIMADQQSYNAFMDRVAGQSGWNDKANFASVLTSTNIDFDQYNLVIFPFSEGSGSIGITPQLPSIDGDNLLIEIERTVPEVGTADVAYYALVYRVNKTVKKISFDNGKQLVVLENVASDKVMPLNCQIWTDGCNTCSRTEQGGGGVCTLMACSLDTPSRCTEWF